MPYIVTTKRHQGYHTNAVDRVSRRAVATLEEARLWTYDARMAASVSWDLPPSGGTIGPLPDGTVIEVELVSWAYLHDATDLQLSSRRRQVLAAFNVKAVA